MKNIKRRPLLMSSLVALASAAAMRGARAQTAAMGPDDLKSTLNPFGGLRAGNAEGTIPAWTGAAIPLPDGYKSGDPRPDPFAGEKPLLTITAGNMNQYKDKLAFGAIELLQRYPNFHMNIYPTHRTSIAPQYVYDNIYKNATTAQISADGNSISNAYGGVPFPIPSNGKEAMWNHLLAWKGASIHDPIYSMQITTSGEKIIRAQGNLMRQFPYYFPDGEASFNGIYSQQEVSVIAPAYEEGLATLQLQPVNPIQNPPRAWEYLPGERRTRLAPELEYDTPVDVAGGVVNFDETQMFYGPLDEYDCRLVGKQEMYVPYNMNTAWTTPVLEQFGPNFYNPDITRWELHRVWVVEMTLASGKRNVDARRLMYLDEDIWTVVAADIYDASGALWKYMISIPALLSDVPCQLAGEYSVAYDFHAGNYVALGVPNEKVQWQVVPRIPSSFFTAGELAALSGGN